MYFVYISLVGGAFGQNSSPGGGVFTSAHVKSPHNPHLGCLGIGIDRCISSKCIQLHKFRVLFHVLRACASSIRALYQCIHRDIACHVKANKLSDWCEANRDTAVDIPAAVDDFSQEECRWWTYSALTDRKTLSFLFCPILENTVLRLILLVIRFDRIWYIIIMAVTFTSKYRIHCLYMSQKMGVVQKKSRALTRALPSLPISTPLPTILDPPLVCIGKSLNISDLESVTAYTYSNKSTL